MRKHFIIFKTIITSIFLLAAIMNGYGQACSTDPSSAAACTFTYSSGTLPSTINSTDVICITGSVSGNTTIASGGVLKVTSGTYSGTATVASGGQMLVTGGTISSTTQVQSGGTLIAKGGTFTNTANLQNGSTMFVGGTPTLNGTLTAAGATINVLSGGTLARNILPTSSSTLNVCGTLSGTRQFNQNTTLNYYGTANYTLDMRNGTIINNYSTTANVSLTTLDNTNTKTINNYGTIPALSVTNWNQPLTINNIGGTLTVVAPPPSTSITVKTGSVINNSSGGTLNWTPTIVAEAGVVINNAANSTMNYTSSGTANKPTLTNNGTLNVTGDFYFASGGIGINNGTMNISSQLRMDGATFTMGPNSTTNTKTFYKNNGTVNMEDRSVLNITDRITTFDGSSINLTSGCASILSTSNANVANDPITNNSNLNFCGRPPMPSAGDLASSPSLSGVQGGRYVLTATFPNGLANGNYVGIIGAANVPAPNEINGYWKVQLISYDAVTKIGVYELLGSSYSSSASITGATIHYSQLHLKVGTGNYLGYASCANPCAPLPVTFLYFNVRLEGKNTQLNWASEKEEDNKLFIVQRSKDGLNFTDLNAHEGAGNSNGTLFYNDVDYNTPNGVSYYRIKMIDSKGVVTFSTIESVTNRGENIFEVYPNPNNGNFTISWEDNGEQDQITVAVIDVTGNIVRNYETDFSAKSINISSLPDGLYLVEIKTTSTKVVKKVIVGL